MQTNKNVLVSVDASEASIRALIYVAEMIGVQRRFRVYLFHVLPPIPPELLEFGGAEDPEKERLLSEELKKAQSCWIDGAKKEAVPILESAKRILYNAGVAPEMVRTEFCTSIHRPDVVRDVLEAASKWGCGTIVVGRHAFPWLKEKFGHHIGEGLVRKGQGFAIWVVEQRICSTPM